MKPGTAQDYNERIVRTLVYIQQHLDNELTLDELASVAGFSRFHFHRIFRGLTGEPLKEYVRRLRLERAARNLKQLECPVTDIAFEAGFESHEAFTRAFKDMFGSSPTAWRAEQKTESEQLRDEAWTGPPHYGNIDVAVMEVAPMSVLFLRHVGPYDQVGSTWARLMMWAGMRGLLGPGMKMIGIVYDDPDVTPPDKVRYDAAVTVNRPVQPEGEFGVMSLEGGSYAVVTHKGPYSGLGVAYQRIYGGWLPGSGYSVRDAPAFEQYLNNPQNTKPEDLLTLIHIPVCR